MLCTLIERIAAVDPTPDRQAKRQRDALLWRSWPAHAHSGALRITRCAARTPHIRSELTTLPRDTLATAVTPAERSRIPRTLDRHRTGLGSVP